MREGEERGRGVRERSEEGRGKRERREEEGGRQGEEKGREEGRKEEGATQEEYRSIQWLLFPYIGWYAEPLSIGQSEHLVVIKHAVQVLYPLWINITIKDDPLPFVDLTTHIVNDSSSTDIQQKML